MNEQKCIPPKMPHVWACNQTTGSAGERTLIRDLNSNEVDLVQKSPEVVQTICPDGRIICRRCGLDLLGADSTRKIDQDLVNNIVEDLGKKNSGAA